MPLSIKDAATEERVRALAAATGESLTTAIRKAAEERLQRVKRGEGRRLIEDIAEISSHCAALPDRDRRTAEEILGYDDRGLPS
jgi:antitoxin VapB